MKDGPKDGGREGEKEVRPVDEAVEGAMGL